VSTCVSPLPKPQKRRLRESRGGSLGTLRRQTRVPDTPRTKMVTHSLLETPDAPADYQFMIRCHSQTSVKDSLAEFPTVADLGRPQVRTSVLTQVLTSTR
jgi:hypothetical protein